MISNLTGSVYNIYGRGQSSDDAKKLKEKPRELLATVVFNTSLLTPTETSTFTVYVKKQQMTYYDLQGVKIYDKQPNLHELYKKYQSNKDKIMAFKTRKPFFNAAKNQYLLDFGGKVKLASKKNFILEEKGREGKNSLLFGKITQNQFVLDVHYPITPTIGTAIALIKFDSKILSD